MTSHELEAAFLGCVVVRRAFRAVEQSVSGYKFTSAVHADIWKAIGTATKLGVIDGPDGVIAVASHVRQKHYNAAALVRCLEAYEACEAGTTAEQLATALVGSPAPVAIPEPAPPPEPEPMPEEEAPISTDYDEAISW